MFQETIRGSPKETSTKYSMSLFKVDEEESHWTASACERRVCVCLVHAMEIIRDINFQTAQRCLELCLLRIFTVITAKNTKRSYASEMATSFTE